MSPEEEFRLIGRRLVQEGLLNGTFGNMSVRMADGFLITATGSYMDDPGPLIHVPMGGPVPPAVSSEWRAHHMVYERTSYQAVVHAHPAHAVALSLASDLIIPRDSEGEMFTPRIPVTGGRPGSPELARNIAEALTAEKVVIARGHGTFAAGNTLRDAYLLTSLTEHACRVLLLSDPLLYPFSRRY